MPGANAWPHPGHAVFIPAVVLMGDYAAREGNIAGARDLYRHSLDVEQNPYAHMKLGVLFMKSQSRSRTAGIRKRIPCQHGTGRSVDRCRTFQRTISRRSGLCSEREAQRRCCHLRHALALQPGMKEAEELLRQLQ